MPQVDGALLSSRSGHMSPGKLSWNPVSVRDITEYSFKAGSPCVTALESDEGEDFHQDLTSSEDGEDNVGEDNFVVNESELVSAVRHGRIADIQRIIEEGADVNACDESGQTPLFKAAATGNVQVLATMLLAKADPSMRSRAGARPLDVASDKRLIALMTAMAPPAAGLVADFSAFDEAVSMLPEALREDVLDAAESETRQMQI